MTTDWNTVDKTLCASHLQAHFSQKYWLEPSRISGSTNALNASSYNSINCLQPQV